MIRRVLAPLGSATTYQRGAYLLLGGVLLLPYGIVVVGLSGLARDRATPLLLDAVIIAATAVIGLTPPFLSGARALEIAAARWLLGVHLPDPPGPPAREARVRAALWFAVHLAVGAVVGLALFAGLPTAAALLVTRTGWQAFGFAVLGVVMLVGTVYATAGLGALAAGMAPVLLGPSADERVAAVRAEARRLAERNRLARELHDSVGHALTVTVLQAAAAGELLARDPSFARRALTAIEETGRAAMEDLDHVLGLLRDETPRPPRGTPSASHLPPDPAHLVAAEPDSRIQPAMADLPAMQRVPVTPDPATAQRGPAAPDLAAPQHGPPDLHDLGRLAAGAGARLTTAGPLADVPPELSREAYRVVQESLTNALRHAAPAPVSLHVVAGAAGLVVEVSNPLPGRGLAGMRERVALLGGDLVAGPDGDRWRVRAEWPR